ncbi:hypothetical protein [Vibrio pomeroyi]
MLESTLSHLGAELKDFTNSKLSLDDLNDPNLFTKPIKFIDLVCGVDLKKETVTYERIKNFQKLRNQIVHQNSRIKGKTEKSLKDRADGLKNMFPGIEVNEDTWDFYITESTLIEELVGVVEAFIKLAISEIEKKVFVVQTAI